MSSASDEQLTRAIQRVLHVMGYHRASELGDSAEAFFNKRSLQSFELPARDFINKLQEQYGKSRLDTAWRYAVSELRREERVKSKAAAETYRTLPLSLFIEEFRKLERQLPRPAPWGNHVLWYLGSLIAELTYYHIPQEEIDEQHKRTLLMPCEAFQQILNLGVPSDMQELIELLPVDGESLEYFVLTTDKVVAVCIRIEARLFIGFRGTLPLYLGDWRVNSDVRLTTPKQKEWSDIFSGGSAGRYHRGFANESLRIFDLVNKRAIKATGARITDIILSGHSLGGAIAAICQPFFASKFECDVKAITFGAPRFWDSAAVSERSTMQNGRGIFPVQVIRADDLVPSIPPRRFGYADGPLLFNTSGGPVLAADHRLSVFDAIHKIPRFAAVRGRPHKIEEYRGDLAKNVGVAADKNLLAGFGTLSRWGPNV